MPTSTGRRKTGPRRTASRARKRKHAAAAHLLRGLRLGWDVLPLLLPPAVILTILILDPAALARLAWSSTTGAFGPLVQVVVSMLLLVGAGLAAWAFWPEPTAPRRHRAPERMAARRASRADSASAEAAPKPRRRRPRAPGDTGPGTTAPPEPATAAANGAASGAGSGAGNGKVNGAAMAGAATAAQMTAQPAPAAATAAPRSAPRLAVAPQAARRVPVVRFGAMAPAQQTG